MTFKVFHVAEKATALACALFFFSINATVDANYWAWKQKIPGVCQELNLDFNTQKVVCLASLAVDYLETAHEKSSSDFLYTVNYLREILGLPPTYSRKHIDKEWLMQHVDYAGRREKLLNSYVTANPSFGEILGDLTFLIDQLLRTGDLNVAWPPYNILREKLGLPTASSPQDMDTTWFEKMKREAITSWFVEKHGLELPTQLQKKLIEQVARSLKLQRELIALSDPESISGIIGGSSAIGGPHYYFIAPSKAPDFDFLSYTINHEFAHIVYGDHETQVLLNTNQKQFTDIINQADFKSDLESAERYFNLGLKVLPSLNNTTIGKNLAALLAQPEIRKVLRNHKTLWIPPQNSQEKERMIFLRGNEQRADLFALKRLFKPNDLNSIFKAIQVFASLENRPEPYIVAKESQDPHPSDIERALYMIGFLIDQDINVRQTLAKWEATGICIPTTRLGQEGFTPKSYIALQIEKAHKARREEQQEVYEEFKKSLRGNMEESQTPRELEKTELLKLVLVCLNILKIEPENDYCRKFALFGYNHIRELYGLPTTDSIKNIREPWINCILL